MSFNDKWPWVNILNLFIDWYVQRLHTLNPLNITIFNTVCIANENALPFAVWMKCCTVDWTEMTFDPPEFLLKHEVVEPGIKFSDFGGRGGDIHGLLTTTQYHLSIKGQGYSHTSIAVNCTGRIRFWLD